MSRGVSQQVEPSKMHSPRITSNPRRTSITLENERIRNSFGETVDLDLLYHSTKYHGDWVARVGDL